jgi:hypothetical protein
LREIQNISPLAAVTIPETHLTVQQSISSTWLTDHLSFLLAGILMVLSPVTHWVVFNSQWQSVILFDTLVAIVWYSWETLQVRRAMIRQIDQMKSQTAEIAHQTRLSLMPAFVVEHLKERPIDGPNIDDWGNRLQIANEGNGAAINVWITDFHIIPSSNIPVSPNCNEETRKFIYERRITFPVIPFLRVKESKTIKPISRIEDKEIFDHFALELADNGTIAVTINFDDIEGQHYTQSITITSQATLLGSVEMLSNQTPNSLGT